MSKIIRFIGDIHGLNEEYLDIVNRSEYPTVQIGDYGCGFVHNPIGFNNHKIHRFIRGNHDDPSQCKAEANWIEDGTFEDNMVFVGGAGSIDRAWRTQGVDWWPDEQLNIVELQNILDQIIAVQPEIIISHECPDFVADMICEARGYSKFNDDSRTRIMLEMIYTHYSPKLHIFGHWHANINMLVGQTRFICLNELNFIDIDTETCQPISEIEFLYR